MEIVKKYYPLILIAIIAIGLIFVFWKHPDPVIVIDKALDSLHFNQMQSGIIEGQKIILKEFAIHEDSMIRANRINISSLEKKYYSLYVPQFHIADTTQAYLFLKSFAKNNE